MGEERYGDLGLNETELTALATRLGDMILRGLGTRSIWALRTSLDAADTEGVAGICVLRIPPKKKDYLEVNFTVGSSVDVVSRWGDSA